MENHKWLAGWSATRLHAVHNRTLRMGTTGDYGSYRAECGAWVYKEPRTWWAAKRIDTGVARCKHCERILAK